MASYKEVHRSVQVPPNSGIEGMLLALKTVLRRGRIKSIQINEEGVISYIYYSLDEEGSEESSEQVVDFSQVSPFSLIRNRPINEVIIPDDGLAPEVVAMLFDIVARERMNPIAFVCGTATRLWQWYEGTADAIPTRRDTLFGLPLRHDRNVPDSVLLLCAGLAQFGTMVDLRMTLKIEIPGQYTRGV